MRGAAVWHAHAGPSSWQTMAFPEWPAWAWRPAAIPNERGCEFEIVQNLDDSMAQREYSG